MAITKRPKKPVNAEQFIAQAPDAPAPAPAPAAPRKGVMRGKREQISHTMPPELLAKADALAQAKGLTRAGLINLAVAEYCQAQAGEPRNSQPT
jgi:hypothetical protein